MSFTKVAKRAVVTGAVLAVTVTAAVLSAPAFLPDHAVRDAILREIERSTGLTPAVRGEAVVSLFPTATVKLDDVVLGENEAEGTPVIAEALVGRIRMLPLVMGRLEVGEIALIRPRVLIAADGTGRTNWAGITATLAAALDPRRGTAPAAAVAAPNGPVAVGPTSVTELRITDGTVIIADRRTGTAERLSGVDVAIAWPSLSKSASASGRFTWRGEGVEFSSSVGDLTAALRGERSSTKVRITGGPLRLALDGHVTTQPALVADGTVTVEAAQLRRAFRWLGIDTPTAGGFGAFALKGNLRLEGLTATLTGADVTLDGNNADGTLSLRLGGPRPVVRGTLAAEQLNLSPYVTQVRVTRATDRAWSRQPLDLRGLESFDLDLRLSAAKVVLGRLDLGRSAATASLRQGRLAVTVAEAVAYGGTLKGAISVGASPQGAEVAADLVFDAVDLEACLADLFALPRVEGRGTLAIDLTGRGPSIYEILRAMAGTLRLDAQQGALAGINVEQALRRLERRPLSSPGDFRNGRTPFDQLTVVMKVADGEATTETIRLDGPTVRVALGGSASLPGRDLDLRGTAALVRAGDPAPRFELPFVVRGSFDEPSMVPDADALLRRSGPAQQLLDSVRQQRIREALPAAVAAPAEPTPPPAASAMFPERPATPLDGVNPTAASQ